MKSILGQLRLNRTEALIDRAAPIYTKDLVRSTTQILRAG